MKKKAFFTMLAVVLVLVLSLTVFVACNKDKKDNTGETPATYSVTVNGASTAVREAASIPQEQPLKSRQTRLKRARSSRAGLWTA